MSTFLHCWNCGTAKTKDVRLYIANCKHVFCKPCVESSGSRCMFCKRSVKVMEIERNMDPSVRYLFEEAYSKIERAKTAYYFQRDQKMHFIHMRNKLRPKYEKVNIDDLFFFLESFLMNTQTRTQRSDLGSFKSDSNSNWKPGAKCLQSLYFS